MNFRLVFAPLLLSGLATAQTANPFFTGDEVHEVWLTIDKADWWETLDARHRAYDNEMIEADLVWNLDPIDGTKAFLVGRPTFGTLISLLHQGRPILGIIDQPVSHERWVGERGEPSTCNGAEIRVRACAELAHAVLATTSPEIFRTEDEQRAFAKVAQAVRFTVYGGDCYAYGLLAMGFTDLVVEADLDLHDFAALVPVIEGAGGIITDWQAQPLGRGSDGRVVAAGDRRVHAQALALLQASCPAS